VLIPILTFVLIFSVVLGTYWLFILRPDRATEEALRKRLVTGVAVRGRAVSSGVRQEVQRLSSMPAFNRILASRAHLVMPVQRLIQQSGVKTTVGVVLLASACLGMLGFVLGQAWLGTSAWALLVGVILAPLPTFFLQWKRSKRINRFEELLPEAIDLMTRAMRAGHSFTTALGMVADELPQPIAGEFRLVHDRQNYGFPLEEALRDFGDRVPVLAAKFFVTAVLTQRETGGNLAEVLENLASVIRDRFNVMRQVRVKSAHGRMTGIVLAGLPPTLVVVIMILNPSYLSVMVHHPLGIRMIVVAAVLQVVGALAIQKLVRIEY
jgi:tight adherence protein B